MNVMSRGFEHDGITPSNSSPYDVENLLARASQAATKPSAKVQPFEVRENELMESNDPRPASMLPKGHLNPPPIYPILGYPPIPSHLANLANLQLYSLWHQAHTGFPNWPLLANPVFTQSATTAKAQVESSANDRNLTNTNSNRTSINHQKTEDTSLSSNSATESLLAASECHLAVLQDEDGDTPLHIAIVHKNERLIQKLIGLISVSKLTVNSANNLSQTALHLAVITNQPQVVQQLVKSDADANAQDRNGQTPVHLCSTHGFIKCLQEILNAKTAKLDLEMKNFDGLTALHVAIQKKHQNIVQVLIQHGANLNAKDGKSGHTPLHHAIDQECSEILQLLVAKGANINTPNFSGVTPIQNANCCRNESISKLLLSQENVTSTTTVATKLKTSVPTISTITSSSVIKENGNKLDLSRRGFETSPSASKRARTDGLQ